MSVLYFILTSSEDGINVDAVDKAMLEKRLKNGYYGDAPVFLDALPERAHGFFEGVPDNAVLVVKGAVVKPEAKTTVTDWVLPP